MLYHQRDFRSHSPQEVIRKLYGNALFKNREQRTGNWEMGNKYKNMNEKRKRETKRETKEGNGDSLKARIFKMGIL